jgi:hypothetical protein
MGKNKQIRAPVVIAVEGGDYAYSLINRIDRDPDFQDVQIWDFSEALSPRDNFEGLLRQRAFVKGDVRALGIITDAEESRSARQQSLQSLLANLGLAVPPAQLTVAAGSPHTGFLIMPHDEESGCLEHACLKACSLPAQHLACAEAYVECVTSQSGQPSHANKQAKFKVHAIIASDHRNPAMTLGQSFLPGVTIWDFGHPSLSVMIDFIRMMRSA